MLNDLLSTLTPMLIIYQHWLNFLSGIDISTIIALSLVTLMLVEIISVACIESKAVMIQSYLTNIATFMFNSLILSVLSISALLVLAEKYQSNGLLSAYSQQTQLLFTFILFDITLYLWHKANHTFDCLWRFHKVHHCDKSMNCTTAFRIHFMEIILNTLVKALFILITGIETSIVAICEGISTLFVMFHHLNLPIRGEKWLKFFFIIPSLHRVHHSSLRKEHDSNYGAVFSLWDRLFKTLHESTPTEIGLINVPTLNFYELVTFGLLSDISGLMGDSSKTLSPETFNRMVAEAAYYFAEKRGFSPGFDQLDWFKAEQQISAYIKMQKTHHARFDFFKQSDHRLAAIKNSLTLHKKIAQFKSC
ncbi:MAG: sterol desaturase family protein [Methylococcaceae bacterium]|nr:sterol desaturase family protein [Methylococcaceae bacterium]